MKEQLLRNARNEFDSFKAETLRLSKAEIFDKALEIVAKTDILLCLDDINYNEDDIAVLNTYCFPIESIYVEWLSLDVSLVENIGTAIKKAVGKRKEDLNE